MCWFGAEKMPRIIAKFVLQAVPARTGMAFPKAVFFRRPLRHV
ncbi:hypothetical protein HMPREF9123_2098 [Neisseria bacilliformis ATCC BAA-1200]|uniref:Uncharacterized protein n=1 Tax=Neisseria bacilliformis ATCC BAA-1200 TaxID=888742 RepID=F2BEE2_9NEIS|nr:hypothetical protein HMPREF9123_2098 [Neisseria bacilliformis ATCC BAA-1200]